MAIPWATKRCFLPQLQRLGHAALPSYCLLNPLHHIQSCQTQMVEVIHWCLELGVPCMSFYAFSIDNFKRSPQEVADLMALAEVKYRELMQARSLARFLAVLQDARTLRRPYPDALQLDSADGITGHRAVAAAPINACTNFGIS